MRSAAHAAARRVYAAGLRARYGRQGMPWRVHDQIVRIDPRVRHLVPHVSEAPLYEFIQHHVSPGDVVLDVGSFLGVYAILEARLAGAAGRVFALEPTAWSAAVARRHFEFNSDSSMASITFRQAAAGDTSGEATLYEYDQPYVNALAPAVDVDGPAKTRAVKMVSIDDLCDQMHIRPTFIRMDVQGAEFQALRGARRTIAAAGSRLTIVAETHPQCWPAFGIDAIAVTQTIDALGLTAQPLQPNTPVFSRDGHVVLRTKDA